MEDEAAPDYRLTALVHAAEWLSRQADLGVALLLPLGLRDRQPLQRVLYGAGAIEPLMAETAEREQAEDYVRGPPDADGVKVRIGPIIGRPHPNSPGELKLYAAIQADPELAPLFTFNVHVVTLFDTRPLVDLLWADGRVVVEVDSFLFHGGKEAFASDRTRDYQLLVSGYLVLRLVYEDIMIDVRLALAKIRKVVALRRAGKVRG